MSNVTFYQNVALENGINVTALSHVLAESSEAIERQLGEITEKTGVKVYNFPAIRLFKIKAEFKV